MVFAGNVYYNSSATLYNEAKFTKPGLNGAKGTASIRYNAVADNWAITLKCSGLIKNKDYIFQISAQDQLWIKYDISVKSDKSGNINFSKTISDLDNQYQQYGPYLNDVTYFLPNISYSQHDADEGWTGYTILRLLDLSGASGGMKLTDLEPTSATNPFLPAYPNATMVMRAREDGYLAELTFTAP